MDCTTENKHPILKKTRKEIYFGEPVAYVRIILNLLNKYRKDLSVKNDLPVKAFEEGYRSRIQSWAPCMPMYSSPLCSTGYFNSGWLHV